MANKLISVIAKGGFCPHIFGGAYCVSFVQPGQSPQRVSGSYDQIFRGEKEVEKVALSSALVMAYRQNYSNVVIYTGCLDLVNRYRNQISHKNFNVRYRYLSEETVLSELYQEHAKCTGETSRVLDAMRERNMCLVGQSA